MAWWIELHCDVHAPWPDGQREHHGVNYCYTDHGSNLGILSEDNASAEGLRHLRADAKVQGWTKIKGGWACPNCAKVSLIREQGQ